MAEPGNSLLDHGSRRAALLNEQSTPTPLNAGHPEFEGNGGIADGAYLVRPRLEATAPAVLEAHYREELSAAQRSGRKVALLLLPMDEPAQIAAAERAGFEFLTTIVQLRTATTHSFASTRAVDRPQTLPKEMSVRCAASDDEIWSVLNATYLDSLDCPEVHDWRTPEEVLATHRAQGDGSFHDWSVVQIEGAVVAIVLLAGHRGENALEIAYLGTVPGWRGRGLGDALMQHVFRQASAAGFPSVFVNADMRNEPALKLYARWGFSAMHELALHWRLLTHRG